MDEEVKTVELNPGSNMYQQYNAIKHEYEDCVLFFRLGDFYELFDEDAIKISQVLDLTLTGKNVGLASRAPMCGVPYHAADEYIAKLVNKGYKVAICEQTGQIVKNSKVPVKREVVRVITAGTVTEPSMLDENKNNFLLSIFCGSSKISLAYCDISTGHLSLQSFDDDFKQNLTDLLNRVQPVQVIGDEKAKALYESLECLRTGDFPKIEKYYDFAYAYDKSKSNLCLQFGSNAEKVYELCKEEVCCVGGLLEYLNETQKRSMKNLIKINKIKNGLYMAMDSNSRRNLELCESIRDRKKFGSLLWLMDETKTSMGARYFRSMFDQPLQNVAQINQRLDAVEEFTKNMILRDKLSQSLAGIRDIERICGKIAYGNVTPVELVNFKDSLKHFPEVKKLIEGMKNKLICSIKGEFKCFDEVVELLEKALNPNASSIMREGGYIKEGFNEELDSLKNARETAGKQCEELERREREETNISKLKIKNNNVFGYYIEVPKGQAELVPLRYIRKQTLANAERYTTQDLKEIENRILNSEDDAKKLEEKLYSMLVEYLTNFIADFAASSKVIAQVDALLSLATVAVKNNYSRPNINNDGKLEIVAGRHPVVEKFCGSGSFISNDTLLDGNENHMMIITGPNMAGKSTYMRQVALITFMTHIGSFVPAKSANICITDRIYTRVGASDDLAFGQSTFMVEMSEVATILAGATPKSLVIMDEIGRGTSTFDGLSIAWAVVEYICKNVVCKTLFATHYHELSELEGVMPGVKNYKSTVKELPTSVVFLHKIVRGAASKSFGVEVARLAGVPQEVIVRAKEISQNLESTNQKLDIKLLSEDKERQNAIKNNKLGQEILSVLKDLNINQMSPLESFSVLQDLIEKAKG